MRNKFVDQIGQTEGKKKRSQETFHFRRIGSQVLTQVRKYTQVHSRCIFKNVCEFTQWFYKERHKKGPLPRWCVKSSILIPAYRGKERGQRVEERVTLRCKTSKKDKDKVKRYSARVVAHFHETKLSRCLCPYGIHVENAGRVLDGRYSYLYTIGHHNT